MPRLMVDLTGVEYDRLVAYAKTLRRTPQQQAAQIIGDAMEEIAKWGTPSDTATTSPGETTRSVDRASGAGGRPESATTAAGT